MTSGPSINGTNDNRPGPLSNHRDSKANHLDAGLCQQRIGQDEQANEIPSPRRTHIPSVNERGIHHHDMDVRAFGPELPDGSHRGSKALSSRSRNGWSLPTRKMLDKHWPIQPWKVSRGQMKGLSDRFHPAMWGVNSHCYRTRTWPSEEQSIDLERMLSDLEMPLIPASHDQKAIGTLASADSAGEGENLHIRVEVEFPIENMQGAPCISDCLFSFDIHMTVPSDGMPNHRRSTGDMVFKGKYGDPNTQSMSMDMHFEFEDLIQPISAP